jgi:glycosyltransferase involved in cell wall biosynthesis
MKISAIVHTRNSEKTLAKALESISWADELIVVDMESCDKSVEIAESFNAEVYHQAVVPRVDGIRNHYLGKAVNEWILVLDSDEYLAADGERSIRELITTHDRSYDAFAIPRFNRIAGQVMQGSDWYPDHQIRLFRKDCVCWSDSNHQLPTVTSGPHRLLELKLPNCLHIHHDNYPDLKSFIRRQLNYALDDVYDSDPENFDFSDYIARAYENLALHSDPQKDGDLSHALSLLMAWDAVVRGLIHWDSLEPQPPLAYLRALPLAQSRIPRRKIFLRKLGLRHYATAYVARRLLGMIKGILRIGN